MSPRRPAVLRDADGGRSVKDHLVTTAAALLDAHGSIGLTVRDIARAANVAVGALYNHFEDKEELLALALATHVEHVMSQGEPPRAGEATLAENLRAFIEFGLGVLTRVLPAFAGFLGQPGVIRRTGEILSVGHGPPGIPHLVGDYLAAEQRLGRIRPEANIEAVSTLIVGACHEFVLPRLMFDPSSSPITVPAPLIDGMVATIIDGIAPTDPPVTPPARARAARKAQ
jgi:AcrR family transcriptional regulator